MEQKEYLNKKTKNWEVMEVIEKEKYIRLKFYMNSHQDRLDRIYKINKVLSRITHFKRRIMRNNLIDFQLEKDGYIKLDAVPNDPILEFYDCKVTKKGYKFFWDLRERFSQEISIAIPVTISIMALITSLIVALLTIGCK